MADIDWYYIDASKGDAETGPFKLKELKELFTAGQIDQETFVWHEKAETWLSVRDMTIEGRPLLELFSCAPVRRTARDKLKARQQRITRSLSMQIEEARTKAQLAEEHQTPRHQQRLEAEENL